MQFMVVVFSNTIHDVTTVDYWECRGYDFRGVGYTEISIE